MFFVEANRPIDIAYSHMIKDLGHMIKVSAETFSTTSWKRERERERERERDLKSTAADINSITLFYIGVIK